MAFPDIKTYREDRRRHRIDPRKHSSHFLGQPVFELYNQPPVAPVNVRRNGTMLEFEIALPGFEKEEISVNVADDILIVRAHKEEDETSEGAYIIREFRQESVERRFSLQPGTGKEDIEAEYQNGVLKITIRDVEPEQEAPVKSIPVK